LESRRGLIDRILRVIRANINNLMVKRRSRKDFETDRPDMQDDFLNVKTGFATSKTQRKAGVPKPSPQQRMVLLRPTCFTTRQNESG